MEKNDEFKDITFFNTKKNSMDDIDKFTISILMLLVQHLLFTVTIFGVLLILKSQLLLGFKPLSYTLEGLYVPVFVLLLPMYYYFRTFKEVIYSVRISLVKGVTYNKYMLRVLKLIIFLILSFTFIYFHLTLLDSYLMSMNASESELFGVMENTTTWTGLKDFLNMMVDKYSSYRVFNFNDQVDLRFLFANEELSYSFNDYFQVIQAFADKLYFSCVVSSTVGFGDISPTGLISKTIVILQIVCSQFMIVFSVGRLLSNET